MKITKHIFLLMGVALLGCNTSEKSKEIESTVTEEIMESKNEIESQLKVKLDAKKANFELMASDDKKQKYAEGIQDVIDKEIVKNALQEGDVAPDFALKNATGESVSLYQQLENGPVILMWYRGGWCPYCNITLHAMQSNLPMFKSLGANLLALTPELPDSSISTSEKNELDFQVLSDLNNKVASQYKVVFKLTDDVGSLYENGFGLSQYNGNEDSELPLAATYIIGTDKVIKYAFLDSDYRNRAEPSAIIEVLKNLQK